jgi:hypothetical protein
MTLPKGYDQQPDGSITPQPGITPNIVPHGYTRYGDGRIMPVAPRPPEQIARDREATADFWRRVNKGG